MSAKKYIEEVVALIQEINTTQMEKIQEVAALVTDSVRRERPVFLFGAGHSNILAIECFSRAGGFRNFQAVIDPGLDFGSGSLRQSGFERLPGYAPIVFQSYDVQPEDLFIIISNSGRNPVPVQMAIEAKKKGAVVIALTSVAHSNSVESNDSSGKKLVDLADIILDNGCPVGDALVKFEGLLPRVGPGSTVAGATILNAIIVQAAEDLIDIGIVPPVALSGNMPGGKEYNQTLQAQHVNVMKQMKHRE